MMKAVLCHAFGEPDSLRVEEIKPRRLERGQVRIRVRAAGVNFPDYLMVTGKYQVKPSIPFTPGIEAAGEIIECAPDVSDLRPGQRVLALARRGGAFASELSLPAPFVVPIPDAMDFATAAGFPVAYGTAHFALTYRGHLRSGETLLVTGAGGGVGLAAVEIGKRLGARVIAAAGGRDKLKIASEHGADDLVDYQASSLRDRIKELTGEAGVDVVFEPVGGDIFDQCVRVMNWEGRLLVIGFASGRIPTAPANLVLVKNYSLVGVVFGTHIEKFPDSVRPRIQELLMWYADGSLKPHISRTFPLDQVAVALNEIAERHVIGKIVLTV
jgi:NADPH2:quinone reductase